MLYRIKPWVWVEIHEHPTDRWKARTVFGEIVVRQHNTSTFYVHVDGRSHWGWHDSIPAAKEWAEEHGRQLLLAALEPVPDGATVAAARTAPPEGT